MIPSRQIFDECAADYDRWYDEYGRVYETQLRLLKEVMPEFGRGLEVGIGSGRFAAPLGIGHGIDPSRPLIAMAKDRGVEVIQGAGEHLPYRSGSFDLVLMMTVICFLENPAAVLREMFRVLAPGGTLIVGFIEKDGEIERQYLLEKIKGRFLRFAQFRMTGEVADFLKEAGFISVTEKTRTRGFCIMAGSRPLV
ncbi:MAG: hypothetical protein A4E34_02122 [Methanoregula sp. PtaU1.Bin006]|uniref:class I SAM-dependent methyltransferase n=1 Tax=Methanoregula sp. PtaU1.Bin006 TaxID=1811681 RepID=UPI0009CF644D|nr:class I SAM-dependent methyltransferase [Methanoregula sp. PtaU1.Bin006]OPY32745.1 MAG: hypothetical protein A4E34_02122 [Methanoregula sp. PtaU1.Bin006]